MFEVSGHIAHAHVHARDHDRVRENVQVHCYGVGSHTTSIQLQSTVSTFTPMTQAPETSIARIKKASVLIRRRKCFTCSRCIQVAALCAVTVTVWCIMITPALLYYTVCKCAIHGKLGMHVRNVCYVQFSYISTRS